MKNKIITILTAMFCYVPLMAQSTMDDVLAEIERNNSTLTALRKQADADKLENKTDIFLENPQIGFDYLWGNPSAIGSRKDYSISQNLDVATISGSKKRLSDRKNELVEWEYLANRMTIMLEAKNALIDLVYYNALIAELNSRKSIAQQIADMQKTRLDAGDCNILEYNDMQLELSAVEAEMTQTETERSVILTQLSRLNGGKEINCNLTQYADTQMPESFEAWYAVAETHNPVLAYVRKEVEVMNAELAVKKREGLPSLSVGYMGEKTLGELYHGVTLGISVPLWNNKNKVKQARASIVAAEARNADAKQQFYGQLKEQYQRAEGLQRTYLTYRSALSNSNNTSLLGKALKAGEISVVEYLMQTARYYDMKDKALAAERDYQKALAELLSTFNF